MRIRRVVAGAFAAATLTLGAVGQAHAAGQAQSPSQAQTPAPASSEAPASSADGPAPRAQCPEHQRQSIDGAEAEWDISCPNGPTGEVVVEGWVADTRADTLCAQVWARSMATGQTAQARATYVGDVERFRFVFGPPGIGARVLFSLEGWC